MMMKVKLPTSPNRSEVDRLDQFLVHLTLNYKNSLKIMFDF